MFFYQLRLAFLSLKSTPVLSALITLGIAIGIAAAMSTYTIYHNCGANPMGYKDDQLYAVRLNTWGAKAPYEPPNEPPTQLTYMDAMALMQSDIPLRKAAMFKIRQYVTPPNRDQKPYGDTVRLTYRDFFKMFDVPFLYGGAWDEAADRGPHEVVVIGSKTNERLFAGANSVGQSLRIGAREYRIVGVTDNWNPRPKFYDVNNGAFEDAEELFIPFHFAEQLKAWSSGNTNGWQDTDGEADFDRLLLSEDVWLQMWVELPEGPARFQDYIDQYAREQKKLGRFQRDLNNRLDRVSVMLAVNEVVDDDTKTTLLIGGLVLLACIINVVGLILGKFNSKAAHIGVRRALGASRRHVFYQHIMESAAIGLCGAVCALPLTILGLGALQWVYASPVELFRLDLWTLCALVLVSLAAALLGGIFPAWRVCRTSPALYLKIQ